MGCLENSQWFTLHRDDVELVGNGTAELWKKAERFQPWGVSLGRWGRGQPAGRGQVGSAAPHRWPLLLGGPSTTAGRRRASVVHPQAACEMAKAQS